MPLDHHMSCFKTVVGGKYGHAPYEILLLQQTPFLCQSSFMEIIELLQRQSEIWPPSVFGKLPDLKQWCLSVILLQSEYIINYGVFYIVWLSL